MEVVEAHVLWILPHRCHELVDGRHRHMVPRAVPPSSLWPLIFTIKIAQCGRSVRYEPRGQRTRPSGDGLAQSGVSGAGASLGRRASGRVQPGLGPVDTSSLGGLVVHTNLVPTGAERSGSEPTTDDRARRAPLALRILMAVGRWSILAVGLAVSWHAAGWGGSGEGLDSVSVRHPYRGGLERPRGDGI